MDNNISRITNTELEARTTQFIQLFEADRKRIYAYIYAYVMDKAAADDIFQETSVILWREFETFVPETSFAKWANGIVFNRVRVYRRQHNKLVLGLSETLCEQIAVANTFDGSGEQRWQMLEDCCARLRESDQQLYVDFYVKNHTAQALAEQTGRSLVAIRKSIHKIRKKLFDCVDKKKQEGLL